MAPQAQRIKLILLQINNGPNLCYGNCPVFSWTWTALRHLARIVSRSEHFQRAFSSCSVVLKLYFIAHTIIVVHVMFSSADCISSATPVNGSLNGFFDLSSRRSFRWQLTSSAEGVCYSFIKLNKNPPDLVRGRSQFESRWYDR